MAEVWWSAEVDGGGCLKEFVSGGVWGEDVETLTEDTFEFREARIVGGGEGAGAVVMGGLRGPDGMRKEGMGNLLGNEGRGVIPGEEGLCEISGVGVEVIQVTADAPPADGQRVGNRAFGG